MYLEHIENLFTPQKERTFIDRTEILDLLNEAYIKLNEDSSFFQVFSIHGIGGIGKTRLVKEFSNLIFPEPVIFISFEIEKRSEVINNLYNIRKAIQYSCPFFDFALLRYWEMTNSSVLNDNFMDLFQKSFFVSMMDSVAQIIDVPISCIKNSFTPPPVIAPGDIMEFMNLIYRKIPQLRHNSLFKEIFTTSTEQLISKLPTLLGIEIGHLISTEKILTPIFIFDSYQESQPYSECEEWLYHLVMGAGKGLYIITSRESLHWNEAKQHMISHDLQCYPEEEARMLIGETITNRPDLVNLIIESTQCVPIYVDLALNVYESEKTIVGSALVKKALFCDRHKLVHHFINHLPPSWQTIVFNLATIRVFNDDIFQHFVKCRMLDCAPYEYENIIQCSLVNYVSKSETGRLVKLHDVFCKDVQAGRPVSECYSIFKAYLEYICYRRDVLITENHGASLAALFQNALYIAIGLEERFFEETTEKAICTIEKNVVEQLLDVYFTLVSNKVQFIPIPFENIKTEIMKKVCQFIYIKTHEKVNTQKTIEALEQLGDVSCFGKHSLSYEAILYYTKSLVGHYNDLETWVNQIDTELDDHTKREWFYNQIKIYQADCCLLRGQFKSALAALLLLDNNYKTPEDYYSIHRTIGHIQRFNFQLEEAKNTYSFLMKTYHDNPVFREYLVANLAETQCYFPDKDFIERNQKKLRSMETPYNSKNRGKILYALAIANIIKKHYQTAQKYINECVKINYEDGYLSGELFAYMAQAYFDYAYSGTVAKTTIDKIERLLVCNNVYTYFRLQLAIMNNDQDQVACIGEEYDWLDFEGTKKVLHHFLSQIRKK